MRQICLFILCFLFSNATSQIPDRFSPLPDSSFKQLIVGKRVSYNYQLFTIENSSTAVKIRLNKKLIFTDESFEGQKRMTPHLFVPSDTSADKILMTDHYSNVLTGFSLYILNNQEPVKIGFLPLAAPVQNTGVNDEKIASESIFDKLILESDGSFIRISFNTDKVLLYPGTENEEIVAGEKVKFLYNGKKLKEVEDFE
jgi:hypothetical protein